MVFKIYSFYCCALWSYQPIWPEASEHRFSMDAGEVEEGKNWSKEWAKPWSNLRA